MNICLAKFNRKKFWRKLSIKYKILKNITVIYLTQPTTLNSNINEYNEIQNEYIIIHLDEKFIDIKE